MRANKARNDEIWRLHSMGWTCDALADAFQPDGELFERYGPLSRTRIGEIITTARAKLGPVDKDALRGQQMQRLQRNREAMQEIVDSEPAPMFRGTEMVKRIDPVTGEEETFADHSGRLAALDRIIKLDEQESKLHGLHAPTEVHGQQTVRYTVEGVDPTDLT